MQVSDSPVVSPTGTGSKDEARAVGDDAANSGQPRPGRSFRGALERRRIGIEVGDGQDAASAAAMAGMVSP